jgi:hypothetical protein
MEVRKEGKVGTKSRMQTRWGRRLLGRRVWEAIEAFKHSMIRRADAYAIIAGIAKAP